MNAQNPLTPPPETSLPKVLEYVGLVIAPFATLTGLLYYFGWVRTNALFGYFGIDANLLSYTTQDYLVRSVGVAFRPCAALLAGAALALAAYRLIARFGPAMLIEVVLLGVVAMPGRLS